VPEFFVFKPLGLALREKVLEICGNLFMVVDKIAGSPTIAVLLFSHYWREELRRLLRLLS
jgi:hypothetical protein